MTGLTTGSPTLHSRCRWLKPSLDKQCLLGRAGKYTVYDRDCCFWAIELTLALTADISI
ncbi:hypothetical protein [Phormidium nigroviride]|uniref:hypothetical protein n=1 Tax=Phormidium nigroviride TaxID=482564 RepID=UPI00167F3B90|nr:hypothetical protein [Oscillatoria nigro-viridis]